MDTSLRPEQRTRRTHARGVNSRGPAAQGCQALEPLRNAANSARKGGPWREIEPSKQREQEVYRMYFAESKASPAKPGQPIRSKSRNRQQALASVGVPLPQVNLLRWLQASLGYDISQCSNTQLGLELPENWHHVYRVSVDGSSRRYSYCVRVCHKCSVLHQGQDLGSFDDLESALLLNDVFQLMIGNVCKLYVLRSEDRPWFDSLYVKQCFTPSVYVVRPLLAVVQPLLDDFRGGTDRSSNDGTHTPVRAKQKHSSEPDAHRRRRSASSSSSSTSSSSHGFTSTPSTSNVVDTAQSYSLQLVALEYDFVKVIFEGYGETQHLSLATMMQKLVAAIRSEDVDNVPFPKRPTHESDQFKSLYLRSVTAVVARQVFGLLADLTSEDTMKISQEIEQKLPVNRLCSLLDHDVREMRGVLEHHPPTGMSPFQLLQIAVWTDLWDSEYKIRLRFSQSPDSLFTMFELDPVAIEQHLDRAAHRVRLLEWGLSELVRDNSVQEKRKFWPVYNIALMSFSDSVASALILELRCGLKHYRRALTALRAFETWSSSVDRDARYLQVIGTEVRARLLVMLPRGFIDDSAVHHEVYTLVKLRYEVFGTLIRLDRDIMNGQRLREMELYSVIVMLQYIVHYDTADESSRPSIFNDFPEFNRLYVLKRALEVLRINEEYCVRHRVGFFTNFVIVMVYALLKLLEHPQCSVDVDPTLIAAMRSSALVILDVNNRRDPRAGVLGSMYLNRPAHQVDSISPLSTATATTSVGATSLPTTMTSAPTASLEFDASISSLLRSDSSLSSTLMNEALNDRFFEEALDL